MEDITNADYVYGKGVFKAEKKFCCFWKSTGWKVFHHLPARTVACVSEYIFFVSKNPQTEMKSKKKLKKLAKQKKQRRKKMFLLLTIPVENLMGYDDIVLTIFPVCFWLIWSANKRGTRAKKQ